MHIVTASTKDSILKIFKVDEKSKATGRGKASRLKVKDKREGKRI